MQMPGPLWACLTLMWVGSCSAHSLFTCEPIKVHRCLGMPYNMTFFPNMMDHYDQDIAATYMEVSPQSVTSVCWYTLLCQYWPWWTLDNQSCWLPMQYIYFFFLENRFIKPSVKYVVTFYNTDFFLQLRVAVLVFIVVFGVPINANTCCGCEQYLTKHQKLFKPTELNFLVMK